MQHRFTAGEVRELVAGYENGATVNDLATRFSVHRTTVMIHLRRLGVRGRSPRKLTNQQVTDAAHRYRRGETLDQLAERFGVAPSTLRRTLAAAGVPIRPRGRRPES